MLGPAARPLLPQTLNRPIALQGDQVRAHSVVSDAEFARQVFDGYTALCVQQNLQQPALGRSVTLQARGFVHGGYVDPVIRAYAA
jgi:hypothetical protein